MNVLLTAVGSMSALCAITKLRKAGHRVIGCDIYPREWHYESSLCDVFAQAPYANTKEYIPFLIGLAKKENVKYIFPLTDLEIDVINRQRELFEKEHLVVCISSPETLSIVRDKYALFKAFENDDKVLSIPTFTAQDDLERLTYPCVAKPRGGRSSEGLFYLQNKEALSNIEDKRNYMFQTKIEGNVCCVDFVRDCKTNSCFCVPREELLRTKNGAGTTVRVFNDKSLEELVKYIGDKLDIRGVVNMEFIKNTHGYYLIDINPRFSAGIAFSCNTGYDFINAHLACFSGSQIPTPVEFVESIEIKYFIENTTKKNKESHIQLTETHLLTKNKSVGGGVICSVSHLFAVLKAERRAA